ncbi:outer membrane protein assembly factor BamD [Actibacterium sp. XHP0104]|uniref:outer membrane protein assembly factor BamD n=1 Tax=Actibacterium sp. XHP0104 TaxID=2984335 RepID=UPI0021E88D81|nr:outer membrane protein assembly factor BamD [Actibacterium sp. XHP0104]MCV2881341.1 outer membrane protein assembly factor BamD [Actibacterium sp. XHP0104]
MGNRFSRKALVGAVSALAFLAACGGGEEERPLESYSAEEIYALAEFQLEESPNKGERAAETFAEVERLYPYSEWAKRALIMQAYSYQQAREYELSRSAAQRYIDFYPADEDAAYAQYLVALSYYDQIGLVGRDQGVTYQALQSLRTVIERYPDSEYAQSAILKFDLAFNHLAAKEMEVGRYYLKRGHYTAAANRFRAVVEDFKTTTMTAEALYRLIECYLSLGLTADAQAAGAILGYNFQSSEWYQDGYDLLQGQGLEPGLFGTGWLQSIYRQMIKGEWL